MEITRESLLFDLHVAYCAARKHKGRKAYVREFAKNLDENLSKLRDDLWNRTYVPEPSTCFIIDYPKKREVYAARFRDRIVHHLYYNYTHVFFERTFIEDSYSCIKGRGTSYGVERLRHHILSESKNYTEQCFILKIDIRGYFMNINRDILLLIALNTVKKYCNREPFRSNVDFGFIEYLTKNIILYDCTQNCNVISPPEAYIGLPLSKMLTSTPNNCGLPIGNLTSQLFSNVYLNVFDQYVKRVLKFRHYGRYVDDAFIVCRDKVRLRQSIEAIRAELRNILQLELHMGKVRIDNAKYGTEFLGAYIKPFRTYISNQSLRRMTQTIGNKNSSQEYVLSMVSKMGCLSKYHSYNIRKKIVLSDIKKFRLK